MTISAQGTTTHGFFSADIAGNTENPQTVSVNIDTELPTATLTSHTPGQIVRGPITLSGTATDSASGIARVQVSIDGGMTWQDATLTSGAWSFPFDTLAIADGAMTVQTRARDLAGNEQPFTSLGLTVDNTPPVTNLTALDTDLCLSCGLDNTLSISYAASDSTAGITSWTLAVDSGPTLASGSGQVTDTFTWDGSGLPPGPQTLRFTATDAAGNVQESSISVTLYAASRSVTGQPILFPVTALTGATQVVDATTPASPWMVFNAFAPGTGWHIQIAAADFLAGTRVIPASHISLQIQTASLVGQAGASGNPTSLITTFAPLSNTPQAILNASGSDGIGLYTFTPEFRLTVPAEAYAGDYIATLTITILAGP